jgi:hypothetical protein
MSTVTFGLASYIKVKYEYSDPDGKRIKLYTYPDMSCMPQLLDQCPIPSHYQFFRAPSLPSF